MNKDKKILYIVSVLLFVALFSVLFVPNSISNFVGAIALAVFAVITYFFIKKRSILSINKRQVTFLMVMIGLVYIMCYYLTGLNFGFYNSLYKFSFTTLYKYIFPLSVIIISIEIIRSVLLAQKNKIVNVLTFLTGIVVDLLIYTNLSSITSFNGFMDIVGMTLLPSVTFNLMYHYLSSRYGMYPNIGFRLIIVLYSYVIPYYPSTPDFLVAFIRLVIPLVITWFIKLLYEKKREVVSIKNKTVSRVSTGVVIAIMVSIVMLISNQFRFGAMVIGSESMTGELNKGDVVIFEKYDDQVIEEQDIILFKKDGLTVVHRVVDIKRINNQNRYYTKGDANDSLDSGFVIDQQIIGISSFKIAYIGYPTLWIRDIFN